MGFRKFTQQDREKSSSDITNAAGQRASSPMIVFSRPSEKLRGGDVRYWKMLPIPEDEDDPGAANPYFYEQQVHILNRKMMLCPGDECRNDPTLSMPCAQALSIFAEIKDQRQAYWDKRLPPDEASEFKQRDMRAKELIARDWHFYLVLDMSPGVRDGKQIPKSSPCYGDKSKCPAAGNDRVKCPWEKQCTEGVKVLDCRFIRENAKNFGWLLMEQWNDPDYQDRRLEIFNAEPQNDGNCHTKLIRAKRTGRGMTDTVYSFQVMDKKFVVEADAMMKVEEQLGDLKMAQLVRDALIVPNQLLIDAVRVGGTEFNPADFDKEKKKEKEPAFSLDDSVPFEGGKKEESPPPKKTFGNGAYHKPSAPGPVTPPGPVTHGKEASMQPNDPVLEAINDPDQIYFDQPEWATEPIPACSPQPDAPGHFNPQWPKCVATGDDECPVLEVCKASREGGAAASTGQGESLLTGREAAEAWAKDHGATVPQCFGKPRICKPGKSPICLKCEKNHKPILEFCVQAIEMAKK